MPKPRADQHSAEQPLSGYRVAVSGRLAAMSRTEMIALIRELGGEYLARVGPGATHLVVGERSWPLTRSGLLTRGLRRALHLRRKGASLAILRENEFFGQFHLGEAVGVRRLYTLRQLTRLVALRRRRLRAWIARGWIAPAEVRHGVAYFDYQQVVGLRHLARLLASGVSSARLARSLKRLHTWLPQADQALLQLEHLTSQGKLMTRTPAGKLIEPDGQMLLEFEDDRQQQPLSITDLQPYDALLDRALEWEAAGRSSDAVDLYRKMLARWPEESQLWFNLGNALYAIAKPAEAVDAFRAAVVLDAEHSEAWNNLGAVLMDLQQWSGAEQALRQALALEPDYPDAQFNLSELQARGM